MILHSICLQGWRCFAETVQVGPLSDGLNIIHAPNGVGKSTLFEALLRALLDSHRVGGRDVEALRPWGRSLAPMVTVEFSNDGVEYRLTKGFLEKAKCDLERKEEGRFVRFAEGQAAEQFVRDMLTKNPQQKGLARREHWGLAQVLWAPQGELAFSALSGDLISNIYEVLGAQISGPGSGKLEKRISELYDTYYTRTGKLRSGQGAPELVRLEKRLIDVEQRRDQAIERQQEFEELTRKVEDLRSRQAEAAQTAKELEKRLMIIRPLAEEYNKLLFAQSKREEQVKAAEAQYDALKQRADTIAKTKINIADTNNELEDILAELLIREEEVKKRLTEAEKATRNLEDKRKERPIVKEAQDETELARRCLEAVQGASKLKDRLNKLQKFYQDLAQFRKERSNLVAPDDKTLKAIRTAIKARDEDYLRLDAALITLQVVPSKKGTLHILEAEKMGMRILTPEEPVEVKGSPQVVIYLAGIARIRAWGPTGSIDQIRESLKRHTRELARLSDAFGTTDIEALEVLNERAERLDKKIAELNTQIEAILTGETMEDLECQRVKVQTVVKGIQKQRPTWEGELPDLNSLQKDAETIRGRFVTEVEAAEQNKDAAQVTLATAKESKTVTTARLNETKKRVQSLQQVLDELIADGKTEAQRAKEIADVVRRWEAAKAVLEEVKGKLNAFEHDPRADLEKLEELRQSTEEEVRKALSDEKREEGRLEQLSALGTYSSLAKIEEEIASLTEAVSREHLRASAIELLYNTVEQCLNTAVAAVGRPVEQAATRMLQRIAGQRLGSIKLGEYFEPSSVLPQRADESVSINNVSGGEKEQIYLATRLALAEVLARGEKHLVVLDDVLTATDSLRLGRVLRVLEEASERLQIVILTCHPERYGALREARLFDLEDILRDKRKIV